MDPIAFLSQPALQRIIAQFDATKADKADAAFNLFTVSSYNSYLENFHSDIIAALLDPNGRHREGYRFLHLFLHYLRKHHGINIENSAFEDVRVTREQGRLDIWIRDEDSRQSIIIENKINDAADMEQQLDRYFVYASKGNYKTVSVIYLTLDGRKTVPPCTDVPTALITKVSAYTGEANDLVTGWLSHCFSDAWNNDSKSFLNQYIKLLKHLANKNMDTNTMQEFYDLVSIGKGNTNFQAILEMANRLTLHRADKFAAAFSDCRPFTKPGRWKPTYLVYDRYKVADQNLKLDVFFNSDGSASIVFWNTTTEGLQGREILTAELARTGRLQDFDDTPTYNENGYRKDFAISETYPDMAAVDSAVQSYVLSLCAALCRPETVGF